MIKIPSLICDTHHLILPKYFLVFFLNFYETIFKITWIYRCQQTDDFLNNVSDIKYLTA